jgi:hypothetical protein
MIIAIIPVRGRLPLIKHTIAQALKVVDKVICVTDFGSERKYCVGADAITINHAILGKKWNYGFEYARQFDPDFVLYIGSSDWVSDNWVDVMLPYAEKYELVGVPDFNLLHLDYEVLEKDVVRLKWMRAHSGIKDVAVKFKRIQVGHWTGYWEERKHEPIGIGRIINRDYLKRVDYKPFDDNFRKSMDYLMFSKAKSYKLVKRDDIKCLSISSNLWGNFHTFETDAHERLKAEPFLERWFPDYEKLTTWENINLLHTENGLKWNAKNAY